MGNLDKNKIVFIICYNNETYLRECMHYISHLNVPAGMQTDIISIAEADSMTAGYNAGMNSSDAKYKVYLHQDVFIINTNFISDIISVFEAYPEYGMLGIFGCDKMIADANYWEKWHVGRGYACNAESIMNIVGDNPEGISDVNAIDGMLMVTQYDLPWREDVFDGFDFYDISQCIEFVKRGYKIGISYQGENQCIHDSGLSKLTKYDYYRKIFCEEYKELGYIYEESVNNNTIKNVVAKQGDIRYLQLIHDIITQEKSLGVTGGLSAFGNIDDMREIIIQCKFLLWRLEYGKSVDGCEGLLEWLVQPNCGLCTLKAIGRNYVQDAEKVNSEIARILMRRDTKI